MILKLLPLFAIFLLAAPAVSLGEFRAYLMEVHDHIEKKKWETVTGFSPDDYISTHGGRNRLSVLVKATWHCYGDTSGFRSPCAMPEPIDPLFQKGDRVLVDLEKHITDGWMGTVELSLYRRELNGNVYGVRFDDRRKLYSRYFEFNLKKIAAPGEKPPDGTPEADRQ